MRPVNTASTDSPARRDGPTDFASLIAPLGEEEFLATYYNRRPLHLKAWDDEEAGANRAGLFSYDRLMELLGEPARWQGDVIKLIMNGQAVGPDHYMVAREFSSGEDTRPDPALVDALMRIGATTVIDGLEDQSAQLRQMCRFLGQKFGAKANVNLYVSARGVQGFNSHCDPHDVYALQCEGEKTWRIYQNREEAPVEKTLVRAQDYIERKKGPLLAQIAMQPGDLLYIPRGFYHDALASTERSVHLTFGVQPLYGVAILDMLREMAFSEPELREYLAPASDREGLEAQLKKLADKIARMVVTPGMFEDIAVKQRTLASPIAQRAAMRPDTLYVRTQLPCRVEQPLGGSQIVMGGEIHPAGLLSDAVRWAFSQQSFTWPLFHARFCHHPENELRQFLDLALAKGAFQQQPFT